MPGQTLPASIRRLLEEVRARPDTWRLILLPPAGTPEIVRQHVERNRARALERIEAMVRAATQRPELPPTFDVELAARAILDLSEEAGRMVLTEPDALLPGALRALRRLAHRADLARHRPRKHDRDPISQVPIADPAGAPTAG